VSDSKGLINKKNAHVEMMGLIGMGNNPMVGATVAVAVAVQEAMNK
jgi:hypothetical protein